MHAPSQKNTSSWIPFSVAAALLLAAGTVNAQEQLAPTPPEGVSIEEWQEILSTMVTDEASTPPSTTTNSNNSAAGGFVAAPRLTTPDISVILDVVFAVFSEDENWQTGAHDPTKTGFNLQQVEMSLNQSVDPFFRFDANLVFSQFGVEVEEAYATSTSLPANLQLRAGQFLTRFGRINNTHPHTWSFVDQPFVIGKFFGAEASRGLGAELSWLSPLPWYAEVMLSANNAVGDCCARSFYGSSDLGVNAPGDLLYTGALKQFFAVSDNLGLKWGLSAQVGPNSTGNGNNSAIYGTDIHLRLRPVNSTNRRHLTFQGEALMRQRQGAESLYVDYGAYGQIVAGLNTRWEVGVRQDFGTGLEADPLDPDWTSSRQRQTAQVTYYPSHFSRVRLQSSRDNADFMSAPVWATFIAFEALVGAHGAHSY